MEIANKRMLIIIPALNEEDSIGHVVRDVLRHFPDVTVLAVDDGSTDRTAFRAAEAGAVVIRLPYNLGIGGAVQTGYLYAARHGFDIAVQIDADGQHAPSELEKILAPLLAGEADLVFGSRFIEQTGYRQTLTRRTGITLLAMLVSLLSGKRLHDVTSGFRAVNRRVIDLFAGDYSTDFPEVDSLVYCVRSGLRVQEVAVNMRQRQAGRSSITSLKSVYYMIKVTLTLCMRALTAQGTKHP